jgi:mannose-6-phosphate isomerase-like protein (cupin superfamily)
MSPTKAIRPCVTVGPAECRTAAPLNVLGQGVLAKLIREDCDGQVSVFHLNVPPMSGPPLHRHSREDEWFYVLDGEITIEIDGQRTRLRADASGFAPRGTAHAFQNFSGTTSKMLVMTMPGGFERFFAEVDSANEGRAEPDFVRLEQLMNQYGMELLGPPLSPPAY